MFTVLLLFYILTFLHLEFFIINLLQEIFRNLLVHWWLLLIQFMLHIIKTFEYFYIFAVILIDMWHKEIIFSHSYQIFYVVW